MIRYELINETSNSISTHAIEQGLATAAHKAGIEHENRFVSIECVDLKASAALNNKLRDYNTPTDCISISTQESNIGEQVIDDTDGTLSFTVKQAKPLQHEWPVLGQLVICPEIVAQNAKEAGQPEERELEWVVEHGVLHLLGFHHTHDD